jgi:hypothetical protein
MTDGTWKPQVDALGQFIRTQRKVANLSLRHFAAATDLSDAYPTNSSAGCTRPRSA